MKRLCMLMCIVLCIITSGCSRKSYSIQLHHDTEKIIKVELSDHSSGTRTVLNTLTKENIATFIDGLLAEKCYRYYSDPPVENGYLSVYIYYDNGDIDIIGTDICDVISTTVTQDGWYYIDANEMWTLFSAFVDMELLPQRR